MANPYYNMMNRRAPQMGGQFGNAMNQIGNMTNVVAEAKALLNNPTQYVMQRGLNLPNGALQNPYGAVQNMMNNGQMSQDQLNYCVNQAKQILSMMGR